MTTPLSPTQQAILAAQAAESKKAVNTTVLETSDIFSLADYFIITSGESTAQIRAIADAICDVFEAHGLSPLGEERDSTGRWYLLDYGDVVIHIMQPKDRELYSLENFWSHANVVDATTWLQAPSLNLAS